MNKRKWVLGVLLALPLAAVGLAFGQGMLRSPAPPGSAGYVCPLTGENLPCPACCPLDAR